MNKNLLAGLVAILCLGAVLLNQKSEQKPDAFESWKAEFGSNWSPSEETYRRMVFLNNL